MPSRYPFPSLPTGWFAVAASSELATGQVVPCSFMDEELVLFRARDGQAHVLDAYCPHLGAHLGHCGSVEGDTIRCNFHGFCFDGAGDCVKIAYGTRPPPKARLRPWPVVERNGFILVYHDARGAVHEAPAWEIPELEAEGWSEPVVHRFQLRGHPQETSENSVDIGHFSSVHGYRSVEILKAPSVDGPYLNAKYGMKRFVGVLDRLGIEVLSHFEVHVHGLGYSLVDLRLPDFGINLRHFVLATPTQSEMIDLRLAVSVEEPRFVPSAPVRRWMARLLARGVMSMYKRDVGQDFDIWNHKAYVEQPALALGDGPIPLYRKWAKQFYVEPARELAAPEPLVRLAGGRR
jgi:nitrite reductase/ring-hydroxylating ferredoxin subunit